MELKYSNLTPILKPFSLQKGGESILSKHIISNKKCSVFDPHFYPLPKTIESPVKKRTKKKFPTQTLSSPSLFPFLKSSFRLDQNEKFRKYMEDFIISINCYQKNSNSHLFGIFDGHGGKESAELCSKLFPKILDKKIISTPFNIEYCFKESFALINKELESKKQFNEIGNTATIVYINKKSVYIGNVGDSSCLYIYKNKNGISEAKFITENDDYLNKKEVKRIKVAGGTIIDNRLEGVLAVFRSLGDFALKDKGLIGEPHLNSIDIDENSKFLILGSDGVWDVVNKLDIINICENCDEPEVIVNTIVDQALLKGSEDNVSCIVVQLNK